MHEYVRLTVDSTRYKVSVNLLIYVNTLSSVDMKGSDHRFNS